MLPGAPSRNPREHVRYAIYFSSTALEFEHPYYMTRQSLGVSALLILMSLIAGNGTPAISGDGGLAKLSYKAYYGGLAAAEIDARITISDGRYTLSTTGKSIGFLDYLFPFLSRASGRGGLGEHATPRDFVLESTFRGRSRKIKGTAAANTAPIWTVSPPIPIDERDPVPETLRLGALDPVAALVGAATLKTAREVCSGTSRVFNGKVRTDVHLTHLGAEALRPNDFSSFSGAAEKCKARYETLAGGYKRSWFGSDAPPPEILFWITRIEGSDFWIPVRVEASTELAKVLVHLTAATMGPARSIKRP